MNAPRKTYSLKHSDTFLVADSNGDISDDMDGLFQDDTRVLSLFCLTVNGQAPALLSAATSRDNVFFNAHLSNQPVPPLGEQETPRGVIHIQRAYFLWERRLFQRIVLSNYGVREFRLTLNFSFKADFKDIFEVRGQVRPSRGQVLKPSMTQWGTTLRYRGLDNVTRACAINFSEHPLSITASQADFAVSLPIMASKTLYIEIGAETFQQPNRQRFRSAAAQARQNMRRTVRRGGGIKTSRPLLNDWITQSRADLAQLTTELPTGLYPFAGIPWFAVPFGRDAIITALQALWLNPDLARGVLSFLALHQARKTSDFQDAAPGKILHETRKGEMAARGEVPFGQYYGGVDTTPLFVMLAGAYARRTADMAFIDRLWPHLISALGWIEGAGDSNRDGFVDYIRGARTGLANQGWKDSVDSVFHADSRPANGPVALVEVQGYVYAAMRAMADMADWRGDKSGAAQWHYRAQKLQTGVETRFWMEDRDYYAIALDGDDRLCRVQASNAGHLLFTRLASPKRAARVIAQLMSAPFYSGWGIRTLPRGEPRFNPMSYHNGSVWPHDTAICAAGMALYGEKSGALRLLHGLFDAAVQFDMRLPELFCGFQRKPGEAPIAYPVACMPQAWASGSVFMMLQATLGLEIDAQQRRVLVDRPVLPAEVSQLILNDLLVGDYPVSLIFERVNQRVVASLTGAGAKAVELVTYANFD